MLERKLAPAWRGCASCSACSHRFCSAVRSSRSFLVQLLRRFRFDVHAAYLVAELVDLLRLGGELRMEDLEPPTRVASFSPVPIGGSFEGGEVPSNNRCGSFDRQTLLFGQGAFFVLESLNGPLGTVGLLRCPTLLIGRLP